MKHPIKTTILFVLAVFFQNIASAQKEVMHIDSFYQNRTEYLIHSEVIQIDSTATTELIKRVKNWAGVTFVNTNEVLVNETEDQLVFNYIDKSFYMTSFMGNVLVSWYIRLVVQVKDNKLRLLFYDDGNCYIAGTYSNGVATPATPARSYKFAQYFSKNNNTTAQPRFTEGFKNMKSALRVTALSLNKSLLNPEINPTIKTKDDW